MKTFAQLVEEHGAQLLRDHLVHLWWVIQIGDEGVIIETIEELALEYDDPIQAEVGLISIWQHLRK